MTESFCNTSERTNYTRLRLAIMASRAEVERLSVSELKAFLTTRLANDVSEESLANLEMNRVSGRTFLELDDNDLAQLFPLIGERKAVKLFIGECTQRQVSDGMIVGQA